MCIKCHSSYAYGSNPPSTPSGTPNVPPPYLVYGGVGWVSTEFSNTPGAAVPQSDLADQFNPNNLSHHAVFARGKNQPMISSDTVKSALNPSWPRFIGNGATVYVDVDGLDVTLRGTTWPSTVLPGWFIYIGASNPGFTPGHDSSRPFAGNGYDQCIGGKVVGVLGEDPYHCYWANDCLCVTHVPDTYVMAGWYEVTAVVDGTHLKLNGIDAASGTENVT